MAEDEKTPETVVEEVRAEGGDDATKSPEADNAAETGETTPEAAEAADAAPEAAAPSAPATETRRQRLEARRAARRPAPRGPVTPEQREEERQARRAEAAKQRRAYRAKLKQRRAADRKEHPAPEPDHAPEHGPGRAKTRQGVVVSAKGDKTITVKIDVVQRHRRYHKIMRSTQKLYAHDEANNANEGDTVRVVECRPMSRSKRWRLTEVLERAK
jgi:small subunit ribosomal protein S17